MIKETIRDMFIGIVIFSMFALVYSIIETPDRYSTVIEVQEGEIWDKPRWVPEPSYAFPAEVQDGSEED